MIKIIIVLTSLFLAHTLFAQSLQEGCPVGTSFDGSTCVNSLGYNECPDGYTLQYPNRSCVAIHSVCNGTIGIDEFGQTVCTQSSKAEVSNINSQMKNNDGNSHPNNLTRKAVPYDPCPTAFSQAKSKCDGSQPSLGGLNVVAMQFSQAKSAGNTAQACSLAKQLAASNVAANSTFITMCQMAIRDCKAQCSDDIDMSARCDALSVYSNLAALQAANSASSYAGSSECLKAAFSNKCTGDQAYANPECNQYCLIPSHQVTPQCQQQLAANQKSAPTTITAPNEITPPAGNSDALRNINFKNNNYANEEKDIPPSQAQALKANQNATGFVPTTGSTVAIQPAIQNDEKPKDPSQLQNPSAANNTATYIMTDANRRELEAFHRLSTQPFSLQSLLPKNWNKDTRNPASMNNSSNFADISAANGLSNFQKVTLKLREKKPELLP